MISKTKELVIHFPELSPSLTIHINFNRKSNFVWFFIFFTLNVTPSLFIVYNPLSPLSLLSSFILYSNFLSAFFSLFTSFLHHTLYWIAQQADPIVNENLFCDSFCVWLTSDQTLMPSIPSFLHFPLPPQVNETCREGEGRENETKANVCSKHLTCWLKHSLFLSLFLLKNCSNKITSRLCCMDLHSLFSCIALILVSDHHLKGRRHK